MAISDGVAADAAHLNAAFADKSFQTIAAGTNFTLANNQATPANVTSLLFDKTAYRSCTIKWQVYRKSTGGGGQTRVQVGMAMVWHDGTNWTLTDLGGSSADAGVVLDIDPTTGQITYTSDDNGGTYDPTTSVLTWYILETTRL